jgi:glyoxylase-like metal-dependent hydrolase (beta-lactamase superfamily II)
MQTRGTVLEIFSLEGNRQRLDGGAMFGNAPRALWSRWCAPDDLGRIELACRALLVHDGNRNVLLESGIGAYMAPDLRERYGVFQSEHVLLASLESIGLRAADIDVIVLSHLHFDHAGGILAPYERDVAPRLLFERASFVVGRRAYERATAPHPRDQASFIPELPGLLEQSGRLLLVDSPEAARAVVGDRFHFRLSDGHTPGMLHTEVHGTVDRVFFCADLVPGKPWVHLPITMGYDRFPELLIDEKTRIETELGERGTWLYFTHDPGVAAARIARDGRGRFRPTDELTDFCHWDLDRPRAART